MSSEKRGARRRRRRSREKLDSKPFEKTRKRVAAIA